MNRTTIDLCSLLYVPLLQPAPLCAGQKELRTDVRVD